MCGVVGVWGSEQSSLEVFQGLLLLQHRGQDAAGIISDDSQSGRFRMRKALGQVNEAINASDLKELPGHAALGHTRYSTIGTVKTDDIQPLAVTTNVSIAGVHNGNVSNARELKDILRGKGRFLMTDNDLELLLHLVVDGLTPKSDFSDLCQSVEKLMATAQGGYACVMIWGGRGMFAFKDPHGVRPLCFGKKDRSIAFASESSALNFLGYKFERELQPGELIWIDENGEVYSKVLKANTPKACFFEWIYFAGAESKMADVGIYEARLKLGQALATKIKDAKDLPMIDVVASVPDTARPAAAALAEALNIPFREVLIKNRYVQRSFILNGQEKRKQAVGLKFSVVADQVKDKNVLLVDDSIVRGTTSRRLVELLKNHGAKSVIFASTCPPVKYPCFYGIDFPTGQELIAHGRTIAQVQKELGCEGLIYADQNDLTQSLSSKNLCTACLDEKYPYPVGQQ